MGLGIDAFTRNVNDNVRRMGLNEAETLAMFLCLLGRRGWRAVRAHPADKAHRAQADRN
jgi:hypothetical protein